MRKMEKLYDIYKQCPKCGTLKNYFYTDTIMIDKTEYKTTYKETTNYICRNKTCCYRWEK